MGAPNPVWIDGVKCPSLFKASEILSVRFGTTIKTSQVKNALEKHNGILERSGTSVTLSFTELSEKEMDMIKTLDTGPAWTETEVPSVEKRRRLLAIPHWDPTYGGIPEQWR
jgi:hypothetical protein